MTENIIKTSIIKYLDGVVTYDEKVTPLLVLSVGRVLLKEMKKNSAQEIDNIVKPEEVKHIYDWLKAAVVNNEAWLSNLDDQRRPKKLMKFSSLDQITQEANKAMLISSQKLNGVKLIEGDEKLLAELQDGYYLVKMLTPEALDRESSYMQHCIGHGGYDDYLNPNSHYQFLSLRDPAGKPHVTIELHEDSIEQMQGKQNDTPNSKYIALLRPWIKENKLFYNIDMNLEADLIVSEDDEIYHMSEIANINGFTTKQNTKLSTRKWNDYDMPENLKILGNLSERRFIPHNPLPKGLYVGEDLEIPCFISDNTTVIGDLKGFSSVVSIGDNLRVDGSCYLEYSKIKKLPKNMKVGKHLNITNTAIKILPNDLTFQSLTALDTSLKNLPSKLKDIDFINIESGPLNYLPENLSCNILNLTNLKLEKMPKKLTIKKDGILNDCFISDIYDTWELSNYSMEFNGSHIKKMHGDIVFNTGSLVFFCDTTIDEMPISLTSSQSGFCFRLAKINGLPEKMSALTIIDFRDVENLEKYVEDCKELKCNTLYVSSEIKLPEKWTCKAVRVYESIDDYTSYSYEEYKELIENKSEFKI